MISNSTVTTALNTSPDLSGASIDRKEPLAGDASGREYTRLSLTGGKLDSIILMKLGRTDSPTAHSKKRFCPNDTFVSIAQYLRRHAVPVPQIFVDARDQGFLLVEDVGDRGLWKTVLENPNKNQQTVKNIFTECIDLLQQIQSCPEDLDCPIFHRTLEFEQYHTEILRFVDHYAVNLKLEENTLDLLREFLKQIAQACADHPRAVTHRDFMAWNLHVVPDTDGKPSLRLIDFQDALIGSSVYDLVSLLHDRDIDLALGETLISELKQYFRDTLYSGNEFEKHYTEVLLQRHLRLVGQFELLSQRTGNPKYRGWIPGCLRRVSAVIGEYEAKYSNPDQALTKALAREIPEFRPSTE